MIEFHYIFGRAMHVLYEEYFFYMAEVEEENCSVGNEMIKSYEIDMFFNL